MKKEIEKLDRMQKTTEITTLANGTKFINQPFLLEDYSFEFDYNQALDDLKKELEK